MNSQEQSALTTAGYFQIKRSTVFTLAIACGLSIANVYYNQPLLADIGRSLHISVHEVGFIPTLTQVGYALGLLFLVPLGDKLERRKLIAIMLGLLTFALLAAATSPSLFWLSVSSFVLGFCSIVAHIIIPLVAQITDPKQRGQVIGTLVSGLIVSVLLARTVSGVIGKYLGWRSVYLIAAGLMVVVAFVLIRQIPASRPSSTMSYPQLMQSLVHLFRQQPVLREASFNIALIFASFNAFWASLVFMLESPPYNYDGKVAGFFGLVGIAGAIITPMVGRLADKWGSRILVGVATSLSLSAFVIFWIAGTHLIGLITGVLVLDIAMHTAYISNQIRVYNLIPNAESRLNTVYMVTNYTGGAFGSFLGTYSWGIWQWNGVCALGFFLLTITAIAHFSIRSKKPTAA
ncbi:MFS transporter [Calothrix sp. PCC 7507]|uniref:MFS transporter n=1 Tax=Calothrix sp. PCC 7507 TaxID=99598 RepID=UPI00029F3EDC|nr:MFS transporter [Calothrix sp. PCC 7507]AFY31759.1 major facilitator superfamily MFS_1 [Calothrix sp. PCC 7507]